MDKKLLAARHRHGLSKPKSNQPAGNLIALGSGASSSSAAASGRPETPESFSGAGRPTAASVKRELAGIGLNPSGLPPKKARLTADFPPGSSTSSSLRPPIAAGVAAGGGISTSAGISGAGSAPSQRKEPTNDALWQNLAVSDVNSSELLSKIKTAEEKLKTSRIPKYLCSIVKLLSEKRHKPVDPLISVALSYLVNHNPAYFQEQPVVEGFSSLLRRHTASGGVPKVGKWENHHAALVCNLMLKAFAGVESWPVTFIRVFLEDSLTDRSWVDKKECQAFVKQLLTVFNTELPPPEFLISLNFGDGGPPTLTPNTPPGGSTTPGSTEFGSPTAELSRDDDSRDSDKLLLDKLEETEKEVEIPVKKRYNEKHLREAREYTVHVLQDWWSRRLDITPKNLLKTMTATCGLMEVRQAASQKLETWLQNSKLQKVALELLMSVCINCSALKTQADLDILSCLTRVRGLKGKPVLNAYFAALKELFGRHKENLGAVMKLVLHNELSPAARAPHNLLLLQLCFQFDQTQASDILAELFAEFLVEREDFLKALRGLLRDFARNVLRNEFPMLKLGSAFLRAAAKKHGDLVFELRDRTFLSLADLVCLTVFLGVTPQVKECAQLRKDLSLLRRYQREVSELERKCVDFLQRYAEELYTPTEKGYVSGFYRFLFLDKTDFYTNKDAWPSEQEKNVMLRLINDAPLHEETLLTVLSVGLSDKHPIGLSDSMELADALVRRAALAYAEDNHTLTVTKLNLIDLLFNSCVFHVPKNISLPSDYHLPLLAVTIAHWKAMLMLVIVSAYNPVLIGNLVWSVYPTSRFMMEMAMIQEYTFPPVTAGSEEKSLDALKADDIQATELEKHKIIEVENFLASLSTKVAITEQNSHLLSKVMELNPKGPGRKPPDYILEQLKSLNQQLNLGMLLCKSRNPDFLLQIINRQGASSSSPWLIRLIESNEGSLDVLPVQCLCEFYLHQLAKKFRTDGRGGADVVASLSGAHSSETVVQERKQGTSGFLSKKERAKKELEEQNEAAKLQRMEEMKRRLREILWDESEGLESVEQALIYFLSRLQSDTSSDRNSAWRALDELLRSGEEMETEMSDDDDGWLFGRLPQIPQFKEVKGRVCEMLRKCCLVETCLERLCSYVRFVTENFEGENLRQLVEDFASMIVDRQTLMKSLFPSKGTWPRQNKAVLCILMKTFHCYLKLIRENEEELIQWSTNQNEIIVEWSKDKGESAIIRVTVVHAMISLLCIPDSATEGDPEARAAAAYIADVWFPQEGTPPRAYLVDTTEDAELTPDWLKARMLQSENERLVNGALGNLEGAQILMFLQMFGLPAKCVSKLLALLDAACDKSEVRENLQSGFLGCSVQFVKAHKARGCAGGDVFLKYFDKGTVEIAVGTEDSSSSSQIPPTEKMEEDEPICRIRGSSTEEIYDWKQILMDVFGSRKEVWDQWSALVVSMAGKESSESLDASIDWLIEPKTDGFWDSVFETRPWTFCTFFGILLNAKSRNTEICGFAGKILEEKRKKLPIGVKKVLERATADVSADGLRKKEALSPTKIESKTKSPRSVAAENRQRDVKALLKEMRNVKKGDGVHLESLLDELLKLDPDLVKLCPDEELRAIFGRDGVTGQRHILNSLPHKVRFSVLNSILGKLLKSCDKNMNPTLVLDFVFACIHLPQIGRGRDKYLPRHHILEDVLALDGRQLASVVDYIIEECSECDPRVDSEGKISDSATEENVLEWAPLGLEGSSPGVGTLEESREERVKKRVQLVLQCVVENEKKLGSVLERLLERVGEAGCDEQKAGVGKLVLMELYFVKPDAIAGMIPKESLDPEVSTAVHAGCNKFDAVLYHMIVELFRVAESPKSDRTLDRLCSALRKLASSHSTLVIRHLSLIAALIRGFPDWTMRKYHGSNVLTLLREILSILHVLKPTLFDRHYSPPFQDLLGTYFEFIKNHGLRNPKFVFYVDSTLDLLEAYFLSDGEVAGRFLERQVSLLQVIHMRYPELPHGKSLFSQMAMPLSTGELQQAATEAQEAGNANFELTPTLVRPPSPVGNQQARNLLLRLIQSKSNLTELVNVLKEIEDISQRKPDCLQYFKGELEGLITHWDPRCRKLALGMLAKYLKEKGAAVNKGILRSYLSCLGHSDPEIALLALEFVGDFVTVFRDKSSLILKEAFRSEMPWDIGIEKKVHEAMESGKLKWNLKSS